MKFLCRDTISTDTEMVAGLHTEGGVALEFPPSPPPPPKKSEFLIIIINGNSEQNSFLLLKNVNQSKILLLFCLKISITSSKFTAESSGILVS